MLDGDWSSDVCSSDLLVVLVGGIMYLNQFREGLIDAKVESLLTQGEIIAAAVSASA
jgi:two-component system sensor histidine kinase ChvG